MVLADTTRPECLDAPTRYQVLERENGEIISGKNTYPTYLQQRLGDGGTRGTSRTGPHAPWERCTVRLMLPFPTPKCKLQSIHALGYLVVPAGKGSQTPFAQPSGRGLGAGESTHRSIMSVLGGRHLCSRDCCGRNTTQHTSWSSPCRRPCCSSSCPS